VVLTAVTSAAPREGIDFFPLTVDYREKTSAAGKFPGGFIKREGRPTTKETLTMRNIDRPIRPLFPKDFKNEVLIMSMVLSADQQNDPDVPAMIGASAALTISSIPFEGPTAAVRIGRVNKEFVVQPTNAELEASDLDLLVGGTVEAVNMIEVGAREVSEKDCADGIALGHRQVVQICEMILELKKLCGKPTEWKPPAPDTELTAAVEGRAAAKLREIKGRPGKQARNNEVDELRKAIIAELAPAAEPGGPKPRWSRNQVSAAFEEINEKVTRRLIIEGTRPDGRAPGDIRPITCEVGVLPRTHGSAVFSRGETQALVTATLGTSADEQVIDGLTEEYAKKFMLHYNFPSFSTGEVKLPRGPGRREIGHGALAERSVEGVLPTPDKFPYTVRIVSDILESNGSSSMATVCGSTLALMDAGVPIRQPVAGISIGWVREDGKDVLLTDILGEEDHYGDMDFKVAGSGNGITGVQLDLKARGIPHDLIARTLEQAREARIKILRDMLAVISRPRAAISKYAPRLLRLTINPEKIGKLIGPGGKTIKRIQDETGAKINVEDDGTVEISGSSDGAEQARKQVELLTEEVKVGTVYTGKVISIKDFGAFIELVPGQDGLCHISELADGYVDRVTSVVQIGDVVKVKVIAVDDQGRVKLSRKAVLREEGGGAGLPACPEGREPREGRPAEHGHSRHEGGGRRHEHGDRGHRGERGDYGRGEGRRERSDRPPRSEGEYAERGGGGYGERSGGGGRAEGPDRGEREPGYDRGRERGERGERGGSAGGGGGRRFEPRRGDEPRRVEREPRSSAPPEPETPEPVERPERDEFEDER
jgi:polyribonucleotide nucleotidyltransferase